MPDHSLFSDRGFRLTVFWVTVGLLLMEAVFFWRESLFYLDGAKVLYELIQSQSYSYMHNRYWMAITQVMPMLAAQDGADPLSIFYIQSLSFMLPPLITLLVVAFVYKDSRAVVLVLFFAVLGTNQIHYIKEWGAYGALYLLIMLGSFLKTRFNPAKKWHLVFASVLVFLTMNTHPTTLCFFLMMPFLWKSLFSRRILIGYMAVVAFSFFVVVSINIYVSAKVTGAASGEVPVLDIIHYATDYMLFSFTFLASIAVAIAYVRLVKRPTRRQLTVLLIPFGFCILVGKSLSSIPINLFNIFYYETQFFLIFVAVLFFPLYRLMERKQVLYVVFGLSVLRFLFLNFGPYNHVRHNMDLKEKLLTELRTEYPEKRVFVLDEARQRTLEFYPDLFPWYESYLISSYLLEEPAILYLTNDTTSYMEDGRKVFYYRNGDQPVDPADPSSYAWKIDPAAEFPQLDLKPGDIEAL